MFEQIKVELQEVMGSDRRIAESAWTSSTINTYKKGRTEEDVKRVVNMLADLKHSVPFESVVFRWWIKLPISVDRQFMTHRLQSASGMSARYRTMPTEYQDLPEDIEAIISKFEAFAGDPNNPTKIDVFQEYYNICESANNMYSIVASEARKAEKQGKITNAEFKRLREFYRGVLPQNNMTERVSIMNLRSWSNFQKLRNSEHAAPEIRYIAQLMLQEVEKANCCPIALEALKRNNFVI